MKVLFILHNNNYYSGANLAMLEVIKKIKMKGSLYPIVMVPQSGGTVKQYCDNEGIDCVTAKYDLLLLSRTDSLIKNIIKLPLLLIRQFQMFMECRNYQQLIKDIDCIYSNTCTVKFGLILAWKYGIPHIWHIREFGDVDHGLYFPLGKKRYFKKANDISSGVITISKCLFEELTNYFMISNLELVYDDIDEKYVNYTIRENKSTLNVLVAGDIKSGKGQLDVIKAVHILQLKGYCNYKLHIAGKVGDDSYKKKIDNFIAENNMNNNVEYLGHISDMNALRKTMDIGVVSSTSEAFGRVTVEGMLSCMAMIGRNSGATPEIIEDGKTGLLYDGSVENLADKLKLLADYKVRRRISEDGYKKAVETYINGNCAKNVERIIINKIGRN